MHKTTSRFTLLPQSDVREIISLSLLCHGRLFIKWWTHTSTHLTNGHPFVPLFPEWRLSKSPLLLSSILRYDAHTPSSQFLWSISTCICCSTSSVSSAAAKPPSSSLIAKSPCQVQKGVTPETFLNSTYHRTTSPPAVLHAMSTAFGDRECQSRFVSHVLPPNPTKDLMSRRLSNEVAARRSSCSSWRRLWGAGEGEQWRERALVFSSILSDLNNS